ncbi:MAG: glycosyltransferase family 4 protein, partial [Bacteroidota bacterium]
MRLAVLADRLILGGLETHIVTYANELLRRGHHLLLYTAFIEPGLLAQIDRAGGRFLHREWTERTVEDIAAFRPEVIHAHPFTAIVKGCRAAAALGRPFVITMHEYYDFGLDHSTLGREVGSTVHTVIAIDRGIESYLREHIICPEKLTVIHNGIDLARFAPLPHDGAGRARLGLEPAWFTICTVSRFDNGKERPVYQLLRCAPALAEALGGVNLIIVGGGSWYDDIRERAAALAASHPAVRTHVAGYRLDVLPYLAAADLVVACDRAAMEAMACARPVFAGNANGYAGLIDAGNGAEILSARRGYRPCDDEEFSAALIALGRAENELRRAAEAGRE